MRPGPHAGSAPSAWRISGHFFGQELERDEAVQPRVLGLVHDSHAAAAELLDDAVVRDCLADHCRESYVGETGKSMNVERQG